MKNVILIVNPVSGKLKGKAALFGVIEALSANDVVPTVLLTKGRGDAIRLVFLRRSAPLKLLKPLLRLSGIVEP